MSKYMKFPEPPFQGRYQTMAEYEEALGYWRSSVGRIKAMVDRQMAHQKAFQQTDKKEPKKT